MFVMFAVLYFRDREVQGLPPSYTHTPEAQFSDLLPDIALLKTKPMRASSELTRAGTPQNSDSCIAGGCGAEKALST